VVRVNARGWIVILYRIADGGPFDLEVDNGVVIENVTDDLVNAGILIPVDPDTAWVRVPAGDLRAGDTIRLALEVESVEDEPALGSVNLYLSDGGAWWPPVTEMIERHTPVDPRRFTSIKRSGGCFHMIAREDETRWQRWWRMTVIARRHRKCGGA